MTGRPPTRAEQEENARARRDDLKRSFAAPRIRILTWVAFLIAAAILVGFYLAVS